jgi:hypothetical protein
MTYTLAEMEVSPDTFREIQGKLIAAGYHHALMDEKSIDMSGLMLKRGTSKSDNSLHMSILEGRIRRAKHIANLGNLIRNLALMTLSIEKWHTSGEVKEEEYQKMLKMVKEAHPARDHTKEKS